jgi:hypothetical protein
MTRSKKKSDTFKLKGRNILNAQHVVVNSVEGFLKESTNTPLHKNPIPQKQFSTKLFDTDDEKVNRLHIQIRQDLAEALFKLVFRRKSDPNIEGKRATQRAIIEEALENYFKTVGILPKNDV